jgi:hypothetical protein
MLNKAIFDDRGELVGWAGELLIDVFEGRIEYVRVSLAHRGEPSELMVVVPWSVLRADGNSGGRWHIAARKSLLDSMATRQMQWKSGASGSH